MRIVIPGGSGHVGTLLAHAFHREGHDVVVLSRRPDAAPWRVIPWDAISLGPWANELDRADVVINLAGRNVNCRYTSKNRRDILESRVASTRVVGRAIAQAVSAADPGLPLSGQQSMTEVMAGAMARQRLLMTLVGVLAAAAILLAAIGIQGLVAHAVAERRREFGIRMALGATPGQTIRGIALGGIGLSAAGAIAGLLISIPAVTLVRSFLWNVQPHDPVTYVGVGAEGQRS